MLLLLFVIWSTVGLSYSPFSSKLRIKTSISSLFDNSIDLSDGKSTLIKKITRQGDRRKGTPVAKDTVELKWEMRFLNGTIIGSSKLFEEANKELFSFRLGMDPPEVITGWELAVSSMYEGEIASVYIASPYAFKDKGLGDLVPPHTDIECTFEVVSILPALARRFESVGVNESISSELVEKIQSGESPISDDYVRNEPTTWNETKAKENVKFFDEKQHKIDPNQRVAGRGRGHVWEETMGDMDVEIELPGGVRKADLLIDIQVASISVRLSSGEVLLEGPLHGRVVVSESQWALLEEDPAARIRGKRLQLSLHKSHASRDIWATVLDRDFLASKNPSVVAQQEDEQTMQ